MLSNVFRVSPGTEVLQHGAWTPAVHAEGSLCRSSSRRRGRRRTPRVSPPVRSSGGVLEDRLEGPLQVPGAPCSPLHRSWTGHAWQAHTATRRSLTAALRPNSNRSRSARSGDETTPRPVDVRSMRRSRTRTSTSFRVIRTSHPTASAPSGGRAGRRPCCAPARPPRRRDGPPRPGLPSAAASPWTRPSWARRSGTHHYPIRGGST